jgi:hypothetical protein
MMLVGDIRRFHIEQEEGISEQELRSLVEAGESPNYLEELK